MVLKSTKEQIYADRYQAAPPQAQRQALQGE